MKSAIIYDGPSLLDGKPIVAVAVNQSKNRKTGSMLQTYILVRDLNPLTANKTGADFSICGNCPDRGKTTEDPKRKQAEERVCYVVLAQAPLGIWKKVNRGGYPIRATFAERAAMGRGRKVRLGSYGDPAAVPSDVWTALLSECESHTAYSHQANLPGSDFVSAIMMQSVDSISEAKIAWQANRRTFRVVASLAQIDSKHEILCPASEEAGHRTTCSECRLCQGSAFQAKSIAIPVHGSGKVHANVSE